MAFGQQPRGTGQYEPQGGDNLNLNPQMQYGQGQYNQNQYGYNQPANQYPYGQQAPGQYAPAGGPQYAYAGGGTATIDTSAAYAYEKARRVSVSKAYGEMTIGLIVTAAVALFTQMTGLLYRFLMATGAFGMIGLVVAQVALAMVLGVRVMKMRPATARLMFYVYAALMGFTLSSILGVYAPGTVVTTLAICAVFFLALTMLSLTTKKDMTRMGPILMVGLIVLIVTQLILMFVAPSETTLRIVAAIGVVLFAGMTMYDAQQTRAIFAAYESQGPEMIQRVSILCALNLYLDFVNMFLYLLRLVGASSND